MEENIFFIAKDAQMLSNILYGTGHRDYIAEIILNAKEQGYIYGK